MVEFWKIKKSQKALDFRSFKFIFLIYIFGYIYITSQKPGLMKMHIHGGQESCVSFCHRDNIRRKIQRRQKNACKKQRKKIPKIPQLGIHVSTEFAPNCSTTHVV